MQKILVTGANGQLESEFRYLSNIDNKYQWIFTDREELDLTDLENLTNEISHVNPDILINCGVDQKN